MDIYTLNVGQGQFGVVIGKTEAIIVDTLLPKTMAPGTTHVIGALAEILQGKHLLGVIVTGFDDDHFCDVGVQLALTKYRPDWVMFPNYSKNTATARACFKTIKCLCDEKNLMELPIDLGDRGTRLYDSISNDFKFEVFSPHRDDMTSSNNSSIVCKVTETATGATYLITGDTEKARWDKIVPIFGGRLKSAVMAAPHHGSRNGITEAALQAVQPNTVLISAGVGSQYGHPHDEAIALYRAHSKAICRTNKGEGQSIRTVANGIDVKNFAWTRSKK